MLLEAILRSRTVTAKGRVFIRPDSEPCCFSKGLLFKGACMHLLSTHPAHANHLHRNLPGFCKEWAGDLFLLGLTLAAYSLSSSLGAGDGGICSSTFRVKKAVQKRLLIGGGETQNQLRIVRGWASFPRGKLLILFQPITEVCVFILEDFQKRHSKKEEKHKTIQSFLLPNNINTIWYIPFILYFVLGFDLSWSCFCFVLPFSHDKSTTFSITNYTPSSFYCLHRSPLSGAVRCYLGPVIPRPHGLKLWRCAWGHAEHSSASISWPGFDPFSGIDSLLWVLGSSLPSTYSVCPPHLGGSSGFAPSLPASALRSPVCGL